MNAAERHPAGREIFLQECARCHGRKGEGVKGKYPDALQGERSLEKLARYIERNMPDDDPGKVSGEDASAVAHYIYDTFYSREARVRSNKAPRVELARLTNRQYLNSVADLIQEFSGKPEALGVELGLRGTYYNSKDFADDKKVIERLDRAIDFNFGEGRPDVKMDGTNGFSMQWRGSLKAEETGEYEFILKTPNGVRLWLNDDSEPLIDAWVASGQVSEHKATLRLLGGRAYPLRLNYFKSKEKSGAISLQWRPPHGTEQTITARNLSPSRTTPTLVITTAFPPDDSSFGYERGVSISKAWDEATTSAAIEVANYVIGNLDRLSGSKAEETNREAKVEKFCEEFAARAFHRPLTEGEKRVFVTGQFRKTGKKEAKSAAKDAGGYKAKELEEGAKRVVLLTLKSPQFLYIGLNNGRADDFEVAARLSYGLWDSLPDQELRKRAGEGKLHTREQVAEQMRHMLDDARTHEKMRSFFHHWLQMDRVEVLPKDAKLFPGFSPEIIADLRVSLDVFLEDTMWNEASDYRTLLLADYLFLNRRLADFYGVKADKEKLNELHEEDGLNELHELHELHGGKTEGQINKAEDEFVKVRFEAEKRCGILTHPYLLSAFSYQKLTSPIHRGVFLTRNIVGRALRPPPKAMTFQDADFSPGLTMRQKVAQLTSPEACQSCHSMINPLGFSLEQYDAVGRFRTKEDDRLIDAVSNYISDDGETIHLSGAQDIARYAIASEQAQNGFIEQLFHTVVKQPILAYGADSLGNLRQSFVGSNFNMQKLLSEIVIMSALHGIEKNAPVTTAVGRR